MRGRARRFLVRILVLGAALVALCLLLPFPGVPRQRAEAPPRSGDAESFGDRGGQAESRADGEGGPGPTAAALADRLGGLLFAVEHALAEQDLGAACAALAAAEPLRSAQNAAFGARIDAAAARVEHALAAAVTDLERRVDDGRILEAREQLARLRRNVHPRVEEALRQMTERRQWPLLPNRVETPSDGDAPPALAAGRLVRSRRGGTWVVGRVLATTPSTTDEVGVRWHEGDSASFSFVSRSALEPVAATTGEAADQARAALRAGDAPLAALWIDFAIQRGHGGDPEVARVRAVLQATPPR